MKGQGQNRPAALTYFTGQWPKDDLMNTATNATPVTATPATTANAILTDKGIETAGNFFLSAAGIPAAPEGFRQVTVNSKQTAAMKKAGKEAAPNVYVTVPATHTSVATIMEHIEILAPFVSVWLRQQEDAAIATYHKSGGTKVFPETMNFQTLISKLEDAGSTGLDSVIITDWFTAEVAPNLLGVLVGKMGCESESDLTDDQVAKANAVIQANLALFISLASGKTKLATQQRAALRKVLELTNASASQLGVRFIARFDKQDKEESESVDALGGFDL